MTTGRGKDDSSAPNYQQRTGETWTYQNAPIIIRKANSATMLRSARIIRLSLAVFARTSVSRSREQAKCRSG